MAEQKRLNQLLALQWNEWEDVYGDRIHPMVRNLNLYLDGMWGRSVDSSVARRSGSTDCILDGAFLGQIVREYDHRTNADGLYSEYIEYPVVFVSGHVEPRDIVSMPMSLPTELES